MATLREWMTRLWGTLRPGRRDDDLEQELRLHLELAAEEERRRADSPHHAERAAVMRAGAVAQSMDAVRDQRGLPWLDELTRDLRHGLRALRRSPMFTTVALATLAIGIGSTTAIFSVVNAVILRPLPYPQPDALVGVWHSAQFQGITSNNVRLSSTMYLTYREHNQTFENFGVWRLAAASVTGRGEPEEVRTVVVTHGVLPALSVTPAIGRWFSPADDAADTAETVILTYGYWQRRLGADPGIVGRAITIDSRPREIIGVMPEGFRFLDADPDIILPQRFQGNDLRPNDVHAYVGIARLKPGISLAQASADVRRMLPIWIAEYGTNGPMLRAALFGPALRPVKEDVVGDAGQVLWVLMGTIGIVLLIVCANVANLHLVRAGGRQHELTVRAALGADWRRLARQLLVESAILGVLGGAVGLVFAHLGLGVLAATAPSSLPRLAEISIDPLALTFTLAVSLLCSLLFGLAPVVKYARPQMSRALHGVLHGGSRTLGQSRERLRSQNALVVAQVALAVVLLVASGLMIRTFEALRNVDPGFTRDEMIQTVRISIPDTLVPEPERVVRVQQEIADRIAAIPGVTYVAFATALPMEMEFENNTVVTAEGQTYDAGIPPLRRSKFASPGLFRTLGTPLIAGRDFTWTDIHDNRAVAIVSASMAQEIWGEPSAAVGKRIRVGRVGAWNEIVGVAGDVRDSGVHQDAPAIVYWRAGVQRALPGTTTSFVPRAVTLAIRSPQAGTDAFVTEVSRAVWAVNPHLPLARVQTLADVYNQSMSRTSFTLVMLAIAGSMALALGIVGIYGVLSYAVLQRRREIGIRLALGAQRGELRGRFVRHGLFLAGAGVVIGLAAAGGLTQLLSSLLFEVSPLDPLTYVAVAFLLIAAAALASYIPARRASAVAPVEALSAE